MVQSYTSVFNPMTIILTMAVIAIVVHGKNNKQIFINLFTLTCLFEIVHFQGYFLVSPITGNESSYERAMEYVMFIASMIYIRHVRIKRSVIKAAVFFFTCVSISAGLELIFPYEQLIVYSWDSYFLGNYIYDVPFKNVEYVMLFPIKVMMPLLNVILPLFIVKSNFTTQDILVVLDRLYKSFKIYSIYVLIEFIVKNVFDSTVTIDFANWLFGKGASTLDILIARTGGMYALQGLTREPSNLAYTLMCFCVLGYFTFFLRGCKPKISYWLFCGWTIFLMFISGSFSAFLLIACLSLFIILMRAWSLGKLKRTATMIAVITIGTLFLFGGLITVILQYGDSYFAERFRTVFYTLDAISMGTILTAGKTLAFSSALSRFGGIYFMVLEVFNRPLFGIGLGVQMCHSPIVSMLVAVGFIGMYAWYRMITAGGHFQSGIFIFFFITSNFLSGLEIPALLIWWVMLVECFRLDRYASVIAVNKIA